MPQKTKTYLGSLAEDQARKYLESFGFQLITQNFRCFIGEIDLIMQDREDIVFIEVRSCGKNLVNAINSIDYYKQQKIIKTAMYFLQKKHYADDINCRFDVIAIHSGETKWIKNAFYADNF